MRSPRTRNSAFGVGDEIAECGEVVAEDLAGEILGSDRHLCLADEPFSFKSADPSALLVKRSDCLASHLCQLLGCWLRLRGVVASQLRVLPAKLFQSRLRFPAVVRR